MAENEQFKRQQEVDLVALAYEAALNGSGTTGVMEGLLRLMDAEAGVWIGGNVATLAAIELAQAGLDETMMHSYNRLGWQSPLAPLVIQGAVGRPQTDEMLLPRAQFQQSEFFQEWVRPTGLMQGLLATLKPSTEEIVILSLMRTGTTNFTRFDKAALQRYERVLPHLNKAMALRTRLLNVAREERVTI